jgi:uncharacterized protein (DUF433 family)
MSGSTTTTGGRPVPSLGEFIAVKPGHCGGKPYIIGHRIKVEQVVLWHEHMGMSPREIVASYPPLTLAGIYAALAYYHEHQAEIDADIKESDAAGRRFEASQPSLMEKIAAKQPDVTKLSATAALGYVRSGVCPKQDLERLRADLPRRRAATPADPDLAELELEVNGRAANV